MHIQKTHYNAMINNNSLYLSEKARDDSFTPITIPSMNYKTWRAVLDLKTCFECADNHGRIFDINDPTVMLPPLHLFCRCTLTEMEAIKAGGATNNETEGADYWLKYYGNLPDCYISRPQLEALGWKYGDRPSKFAPGRMYGGDIFYNSDRKLPHKIGRIWHEADINYTQGRRNNHRILWSNDGLIFVTYDHYHTFYEIV